ncbi:hypothetical protein COV56_03455 [Candidatus Kuenenbacteria bacterium CG11_big_fil_rev_8_21_14_0_20_37_9]|nr:MAG: hypothetical protein COV56_03455 [Candidatus Kuenenbacteria bacterium CG11_big_fil_rev_8_21_14_0_20_37_9]
MYFKRTKRRSPINALPTIILTTLIIFIIASPFVFTPYFSVKLNPAQAFNFHASLDKIAYKSGLGQAIGGGGLPEIIGSIIYGVLGLLGVFFLILIIINGFKWMTAGGNEETVTKTKKALANAAIGVLIILSSYAIAFFVIDVIL